MEVIKKIKLRENKATIERDMSLAEKDLAKARKNDGFTQLDDIGIRALEQVTLKSGKAGALFMRLAKQMDAKGAVVVSRKVLAELAETDYTNVGKILKHLVDAGLIRKTKSSGMHVIAINPHVAWRSWGSAKEYAVYNANIIMGSDEYESQSDFDIRRARALIAMAKKKIGSDNVAHPELPPPVGQRPKTLELFDD